MAYPSNVNFMQSGGMIGAQPIHVTSSTQMHPIGTIVTARDVTYGEGEFIYLLGVASTAQGDLVVYKSTTGATTRTVAGTTKGPCAVSMSANLAGFYGWYQISGATPVKAATALADTDVYLTSTAGQVDDLVNSLDLVSGATFKAATSADYATVQLNRPSVSGESVSDALTTLHALGTYCTLSAAGEAGDAIVVTGQIKSLDGTNVAVETNVVVRTLAITADKGDITVTAGTEKKTVNPATGENVSWIESTAAGAFAVSVANNVAEVTLVEATPDNGLTQLLVLTFT